jgi:hypothetical protein
MRMRVEQAERWPGALLKTTMVEENDEHSHFRWQLLSGVAAIWQVVCSRLSNLCACVENSVAILGLLEATENRIKLRNIRIA